MNWLDVKYINLLSGRLRNFKRKSDGLWNFSCPICGDSKNNKTKSRGYLYEKGGSYRFHCHNCGIDMTFVNFIKKLDMVLYEEYKLETLKEKNPIEYEEIQETKLKVENPDKWLAKLTPVSSLPDDHSYKIYIKKRKIPEYYHDKLFYCPKFLSWTNAIIPNKFSKDVVKRYDTHRLVIPFYDESGNLFAYAGRDMSDNKDNKQKYIIILIDDKKPKFFNLDRVDRNKRVYILEGQFDSMFIENSLAAGGSDLTSAARYINSDDVVYVFDNEPRSPQICGKMQAAISRGDSIVIWPECIKQKDINEMIMNGISVSAANELVRDNTYSGAKAQLVFNKWKKVGNI